MSEMVARLARALDELEGVDITAAGFPRMIALLTVARAAIQAMREPTDGMVKQAEMAIFEHMAEPRDWTLKAAKDGWEAAIDEALR